MLEKSLRIEQGRRVRFGSSVFQQRYVVYDAIDFGGSDVYRQVLMPRSLADFFERAVADGLAFEIHWRTNSRNWANVFAIKMPDGRVFYDAGWLRSAAKLFVLGVVLFPAFGLMWAIGGFRLTRHFKNKRIAGPGAIGLF